MLLGALTAACGGHSVSDKPGGAAGSPPIGAQKPGDAKPPDMNAPTPLPIPCEYESLDARCANSGCPTSPDDFGDQCAEGFSVSRTSTVCGGTVVVVGFTFGQSSWYFDADGMLTGSIGQGDLLETCPDGHRTSAKVYGSVCQTSGILLDACPATSDACGAPHMCAPGPTCPLHSADVLSTYCPDPTTEVVQSWDTTCGGHMLTVTRTSDEVRYCYDARDQLTGVATHQVSDNSWSVEGTDCRETNLSSLPCVPK